MVDEQPILMSPDDARRAGRKLNRRFVGGGGIEVRQTLDTVTISRLPDPRFPGGGGAMSRLAQVNSLGQDPGPYLGCYWLELDENKILVPITDKEYKVRAFVFDFESWTKVTPAVRAGTNIPVMIMAPDQDEDGQPVWYCMFPFVGTCESGGMVPPPGGAGSSLPVITPGDPGAVGGQD